MIPKTDGEGLQLKYNNVDTETDKYALVQGEERKVLGADGLMDTNPPPGGTNRTMEKTITLHRGPATPGVRHMERDLTLKITRAPGGGYRTMLPFNMSAPVVDPSTSSTKNWTETTLTISKNASAHQAGKDTYKKVSDYTRRKGAGYGSTLGGTFGGAVGGTMGTVGGGVLGAVSPIPGGALIGAAGGAAVGTHIGHMAGDYVGSGIGGFAGRAVAVPAYALGALPRFAVDSYASMKQTTINLIDKQEKLPDSPKAAMKTAAKKKEPPKDKKWIQSWSSPEMSEREKNYGQATGILTALPSIATPWGIPTAVNAGLGIGQAVGRSIDDLSRRNPNHGFADRFGASLGPGVIEGARLGALHGAVEVGVPTFAIGALPGAVVGSVAGAVAGGASALTSSVLDPVFFPKSQTKPLKAISKKASLEDLGSKMVRLS